MIRVVPATGEVCDDAFLWSDDYRIGPLRVRTTAGEKVVAPARLINARGHPSTGARQ